MPYKDTCEPLNARHHALTFQKHKYRDITISVEPKTESPDWMAPAVLSLPGQFGREHRESLEGRTYKGLKVGLFRKSCRWLVKKNRPLQSFVRRTRILADWLPTEKVLPAAAASADSATGLTGSPVLVCLAAWLEEDAEHREDFTAAISWYASAYSDRVFGIKRPIVAVRKESVDTKKALSLAAENDAALDARAALTRAKHPAAPGPDALVLAVYREILFRAHQNNCRQAKIELEHEVEIQARLLAGS